MLKKSRWQIAIPGSGDTGVRSLARPFVRLHLFLLTKAERTAPEDRTLIILRSPFFYIVDA